MNMSKLNESTKDKIKRDIVHLLNDTPKTISELSKELNRSWRLISSLLIELDDDNPEICLTQIGKLKAYSIKR